MAAYPIMDNPYFVPHSEQITSVSARITNKGQFMSTIALTAYRLSWDRMHVAIHIGILILSTFFVAWIFIPRDLMLGQVELSNPATISSLATSAAVAGSRIERLEKGYETLGAKVDVLMDSVSQGKAVGGTVVAGIGILSILGLLSKRRT